MNISVRFYSKTKAGNTKKLAIAIADELGTEAISVVDEPSLINDVDILFLGGAPYANIMAPELREYAENIDPNKVGRVVLFSTSNWARRTVNALKKILRGKGIKVDDDYFYVHMLSVNQKLDEAKEFARNAIKQ
jgi:flavorubredoxin